jgi:hypothetical protein
MAQRPDLRKRIGKRQILGPLQLTMAANSGSFSAQSSMVPLVSRVRSQVSPPSSERQTPAPCQSLPPAAQMVPVAGIAEDVVDGPAFAERPADGPAFTPSPLPDDQKGALGGAYEDVSLLLIEASSERIHSAQARVPRISPHCRHLDKSTGPPRRKSRSCCAACHSGANETPL